MLESSRSVEELRHSRLPVRQRWLEVALILLVFYLNSGWPVPDNNEAHYLGKAKHFWNPEYAAGDAFFESAHTHQVFYELLGWWTLWLSLPAVAWVGRFLTWALLAVGWQRISSAVIPRAWWSVLSAALMVALQERCQVAGEWLVGGFEAKGLAYALVFFGIEAAMRGCWRAVWLWLGAASAWHVLVGGWSVVAMLPAWWLAHREGNAPGLSRIAPFLVCGATLSLPAVIPGLLLTWNVDESIVRQANEIYVFERLPHHLNPAKFARQGVAILVGLFAATGIAARIAPATSPTRLVWRFTAGAAMIAAMGWLIACVSHGDQATAAGILRFYWFRLADVAIPVGFSLLSLACVQHRLRTAPAVGQSWLTAAVLFSAWHLVDFGWQTHAMSYPRADRPGKVLNYPAWHEVCVWVRENTSAKAKFITPRNNQTFKWHSGRAEVATWKDTPQDAQAIVTWRQTLERIYGTGDADEPWVETLSERPWEELVAFGREFDADYLVTEAKPRLAASPLYVDTTGTYAVYRLSGLLNDE